MNCLRRILLIGVVFVAGCCFHKDHISRRALRPLVVIVADRHDAYVTRDESLTAPRRASMLDSTTILRMAVAPDDDDS